ncbi:hypothetical protein [Thiomicrorhabdus aquaedulcis]|uniref:hypothetical protein n=1 Tax=Thiomicrorhabdus aquaedulcis TaxID=2211106 RepID=UPI000FD9998D|nr:hypothetical protein [Thiomicrorhabdus aquaedulcis]
MSTNRVFLLHDEALYCPNDFNANDSLVYVWDDAYVKQQGWSFKRWVYIYETLCELNATVYQGDTIKVLSALVEQNPALLLVIQQPQDPILKNWAASIKTRWQKTEVRPFSKLHWLSQDTRLKRFFNYWQAIEAQVLNQPVNPSKRIRRMH